MKFDTCVKVSPVLSPENLKTLQCYVLQQVTKCIFSPVRSAKALEISRAFFVLYYVYILRSLVDGTYYKGFTENYEKRLEEHNEGLSQYTSTKIPWEMIYVEILTYKTPLQKMKKY